MKLEIAQEYQASPYRLAQKTPYNTLIWVGIWPSDFEANKEKNLGGVSIWKFRGFNFLFLQ